MSRNPAETTRPDASPRREDRLKSALKANLARRKAQMRARGDTGQDRDAPANTRTEAEQATDTNKE